MVSEHYEESLTFDPWLVYSIRQIKMSIPSASNDSENGVTMPATLAFLVSNFQSLVTIKLNAENFLLWKTQVLNALRANGFIEYVRGTTSYTDQRLKQQFGNKSCISYLDAYR